MNGFVHRLVLIQRQKATREWLTFWWVPWKVCQVTYTGSQIKCTVHRPGVTQVIRMRFDNEKKKKSLFKSVNSRPFTNNEQKLSPHSVESREILNEWVFCQKSRIYCRLLFNKEGRASLFVDGCVVHNYKATIYSTIQYNTIQYNTIQYHAIQYHAMQCNAVQYNRRRSFPCQPPPKKNIKVPTRCFQDSSEKKCKVTLWPSRHWRSSQY